MKSLAAKQLAVLPGSRGAGLQERGEDAAGRTTGIEWEPIKMAMVSGRFTWAECATQFNVSENSLRSRARREAWPVPKRVLESALIIAQNDSVTQAAGIIARDKIEKHIAHVFDIAVASLKNKKQIPVRTAKDFDLIDRVARRAGGMKDDAPQVATLIQLNEAINAHDTSPEPIEATLIPDNPAALEPGSMEAG